MSETSVDRRTKPPAGSGGEIDDDYVEYAMFQEPKGYFQSEKPPTFAEHILLTGERLSLRMVGHSPLWGHLLWNAGQVVSEYLQQHADALVEGKDVLELGAGAGLPGIVCAVAGARKVVITDYPDEDLVQNLKYNVEHCRAIHKSDCLVSTEGYLWGAPVPEAMSQGFDLLILADLLFNHTEHAKLLSTIGLTLRRQSSAKALVLFTPYRPWLFEKDMAFFDLARKAGYLVEKILEHTMEKVMFAEDRGDELLRRTVFGYELRWNV